MQSRQSEDFSFSQGAMAGSDARILPQAPFASTGPEESDSGLFSMVPKYVHSGDETHWTEDNVLGSSDVGSDVVQLGDITAEEYCALSLDERLKNAPGSQIGTVTLNGPQMAQGQRANGIGEKTPNLPSRAEGMPRSTGSKANNQLRTRDANWSEQLKSEMLMRKLKCLSDRLQQALGGDQNTDHHGKSWSHQVAGQLSKTHQQCQRQWDSLLKARNAICHHERKTEEADHVSFWKMTERQKDTANKARRDAKLEPLPPVFPKERYELMEFIIRIENDVKKIPSWRKSFLKSSGEAETSTPLHSGVTESPVVGQVSDGNAVSHDLEATINDNLASTQGNCEGAEDRKLKNDHDAGHISMLVSKAVKDALELHTAELQGRREDKEKHRAKKIELEERKLALKEEKLEQFKRINSMRNASSGQVGPSNMGFERLADGQHVQEYNQMATSGMNFLQLQNANANSQRNTCENYDGQAAEVGQNSNFQPSVGHFHSGNGYECSDGFLSQPSIAYTGANVERSQFVSNTYVAHEAGNQLQVSPTDNSGCMQHNQLHADPDEGTYSPDIASLFQDYPACILDENSMLNLTAGTLVERCPEDANVAQ